jgi:cold shock protein
LSPQGAPRRNTKDVFTLRPPRNERQRQPRRRGFDDEQFFGNTPPPTPFPAYPRSPSGPEVRATLKWFNADKGYGFAAMSDGSGDVFLHANALQAAGYQTVSPGATLTIRVGQGQKGRQVEQVISVDESTAEQSSARRPSGPRPRAEGVRREFGPRRQVDLSSAVEMTGIVKWYNAEKGFGFITPESGGKDVFVHASALERAGITSLHEGQTVRMGVVQGVKGPEVGTISLG